MTIWYKFVFIWCIISGFGILYEEKSGSPALHLFPVARNLRLVSTFWIDDVDVDGAVGGLRRQVEGMLALHLFLKSLVLFRGQCYDRDFLRFSFSSG
jgi:hypothetical protein